MPSGSVGVTEVPTESQLIKLGRSSSHCLHNSCFCESLTDAVPQWSPFPSHTMAPQRGRGPRASHPLGPGGQEPATACSGCEQEFSHCLPSNLEEPLSSSLPQVLLENRQPASKPSCSRNAPHPLCGGSHGFGSWSVSVQWPSRV